MPITPISSEDFFRTQDHIHQFLETAQKHGADGKDTVIGALGGIRLFIENGQVPPEELYSELHRLAAIFTSDGEPSAFALNEPASTTVSLDEVVATVWHGQKLNEAAYESLVLDKAAELAGLPDGSIIYETCNYITSKGFETSRFSDNFLKVIAIFNSSDYERENFRGHMADEGIYEEIKEILRIVHHTDIFPSEPTKVVAKASIDDGTGLGRTLTVFHQPLAVEAEMTDDVPADAIGEVIVKLMQLAKYHGINPMNWEYSVTFSKK